MGNGTANAGEALRHLATAFMFFTLGTFALFLNSPLLSSDGPRDAHVVSGLHFLTLGWLSLSVFGALQVFSGVALGGEPLNRKVSRVARWLWTLGVLAFTTGFFFSGGPVSFMGLTTLNLPNATLHPLLIGGFSCIGLALLLYTLEMIPVLIGAQRGQITRAFITIAFLSIWGAWLLGMTAGLTRTGLLPSWAHLPQGYFQAHLLLAIFGWMGSMVIGVGSHLVPMFALSKPVSNTPLKIALSAWVLMFLTGITSAFSPQYFVPISWSLAALGTIAWAYQFQLYIRARIRKEKDHGLRIAGIATAFLLIAWLGFFGSWLVSAQSPDQTFDPIPFIALTLVGWLCFFTLGIYHRVVPFLVWFVKFSKPQLGGGIPPRVKDLTDAKIAQLTEALFTLGVLIWIIGIWLHSQAVVYLGSGLIFLGALTMLFQFRPLLGIKRKEKSPNGAFQRKNHAVT